MFHLHVSRSLYQFQVHGKKICRSLRRTGVYDQMEQPFTNRKFHFCSHPNFRVFFPTNGKRPESTSVRSILRCSSKPLLLLTPEKKSFSYILYVSLCVSTNCLDASLSVQASRWKCSRAVKSDAKNLRRGWEQVGHRPLFQVARF